MATGQITWEQFITVNNDARGVRYKFEDLCRQLFTYEFLSKNKIHKYVHSNPNNPGIESEPILNEETDKYIGYQAKLAIVRSKSRRKRQLNIIKENWMLFICSAINLLQLLVIALRK